MPSSTASCIGRPAEERFAGKPGQTLLAHTHGALPARRIALIGLGASAADDTRALRSAAGSAVRIAGSCRSRARGVTWPVDSGDGDLAAAAEGAWLGGYRFDRYLTADDAIALRLSRR